MSEEPQPQSATGGADAQGEATVRLEPTRRLSGGQRVLNRYKLEALLGQGGMAVVWRAWDETLDETVALKFMPEEVVRDAAAVEELKDETRRARRLTHPHIVRIHDFVQDAALAAVSMEYVDGETLAKLRLEQPGKVFAVAALAPYVAQLCAALEYAHGTAKLVHRDIKPANLLVTREGQLKITDFGIARSLTETTARLTNRAGDRTSGTILYASPQQLMGEKPTPADDLYALGATLYELLTGKPPFFRGEANSLLLQVKDRAPAPLAERRKELEVTGEKIPGEWEKTILACLAKKPEDRPKTAHEVAERLGLAGSLTMPVAPTSKKPTASGTGKSQGWKALAYGGVAAVVLGVLGYSLWPRKPAVPEKPASAVTAEKSGAQEALVVVREFVVTVDPAEAAARVTVGPRANVEVKGGRAAVTDLPDGDHEMTVRAPGYHAYATRVTVKEGRGTALARLIAAKGIFEITAREGTTVTAVDERDQETNLGVVGASGVLASGSVLNVGRYTLKLKHPDCAPLEGVKLELEADRVAKVKETQMPLPGELRVFSLPDGAEVWVNGEKAGVTPATLKNQPSEHLLQVKVAQAGYRPALQEVTLKPKEVKTLNLGTLRAETGGLRLRFANPGLWLDKSTVTVSVAGTGIIQGIWQGNDLLLEGLSSGEQTILLEHSDLEPWQQRVEVAEQQVKVVDVVLRPKPAWIAIRANPAAISLTLNGREVRPEEIADHQLEVRSGEPVTLVATAPGYRRSTYVVTLPANGRVSWEPTLEKIMVGETAQPGKEAGQVILIPDLGLTLMPISVGEFQMGNANGDSDERPVTTVIITRPFWLGRTEITQREWLVVMGGGAASYAGAEIPVRGVTWDNAMEFCGKLTAREEAAGRLPAGYVYSLPTEAQWEYACRAGTTGDLAKDLGEEAWFDQNSDQRVHEVARKSANAWGLHDMLGNVWEWCLDLKGAYAGGTVNDIAGSAVGNSRVFRGGSWMLGATQCRPSYRSSGSPGYRHDTLGFRVALVPATGSETAR